MVEINKESKVYSLLNVMNSLKKTVSGRYGHSFLLRAEMVKLNYFKRSGHCYPELVEKSGSKIVAQMNAVLWKNDYLRCDANFRKTLGEPLKDGVILLFVAKITVEDHRGLALQILDIVPEYTMGEMEREKQETIRRLREEGIFGRNRALKLPLLPSRIAIISVETSRGYMDFLNKIDNCPYNISHQLFPSLLQGENVVASISEQLRQIQEVMHAYDAVAIVRGGGGDVGLSGYNSYQMAKEVAMFPLPVLAGVGHATNDTVVEMVACHNLVTPTGLAEFFIQQCSDFYESLKQTEQQIATLSKQFIEREHARLQSKAKLFYSLSVAALSSRRSKLLQTRSLIPEKTARLLADKSVWLDKTQLIVRGMDPREILRRGYSLTRVNGRVVKDLSQIKKGDTLETIVGDGSITSRVETIFIRK